MKSSRRCTRLLILSLLVVSVFVPLVLLSGHLKHLTSDEAIEEFIEDLSSIKYRTDAHRLNSVGEGEVEGIQEPALFVYKDRKIGSGVNFSSPDENIKFDKSNKAGGGADLSERNGTINDASEDNHQRQQKKILSNSREKEESKQIVRHDQQVRTQPRRVDAKLKVMKDQVIMAKAYLSFAPPNSNSHLVKELKLRIKEQERAISESTKDSDLSRRALQRMKFMKATLLKASRVYRDCPIMDKKLRAMTYNAEEQVRTLKDQEAFLVQIAGRTTPKSLHCLSMRLTAEYFALKPEERELPNQQKFHDPHLYHYAVFSDNVLACAVVVDSTISSALEPERIVFHIVTDFLNLPAFSMWFLSNPTGKATLQIQSIDKFDWLSTNYDATMQNQNPDARYTILMNHLRFYLPDVFPLLNKIVLLDHDVIVLKDLTELWSVDMKGKVNGAVETCRKDDPSYRQMNMFINFSDPMVAKRFDAKACTWAFGMNVFDLQEWRRRNLTGVYYQYLQLGKTRPLWKAGSLPIGWATFYNQTVALDWKWHVLGLGYHSGVKRGDIEQAAVIQYNGPMKPWLDIGFDNYRLYWKKHVKYNHPYLRQCNIHE